MMAEDAMLPFEKATGEPCALSEGAAWLKGYLSLGEQRALVAKCREIMDGPAGGYVPTVRGAERCTSG